MASVTKPQVGLLGFAVIFVLGLYFYGQWSDEREKKSEAQMAEIQAKDAAVRREKQDKDAREAEALKMEKCRAEMDGTVARARDAFARGEAQEASSLLAPCHNWQTESQASKDLWKKTDELLTERANKLAAAAESAERKRKKREGVRIGMSQQDAVDSSWGRPSRVNRTTTARGIHEQWVYDGGYLYFDNGVLTSIQN